MNSPVQNKIHAVHEVLRREVPQSTLADAAALRRAALTLHLWYEHECNGVIQRDEMTGKPYWYNANTGNRISIAADREKGAMNTISRICRQLGLYHYLQTDPRGGTLYVSLEPIAQDNYTRAIFIA